MRLIALENGSHASSMTQDRLCIWSGDARSAKSAKKAVGRGQPCGTHDRIFSSERKCAALGERYGTGSCKVTASSLKSGGWASYFPEAKRISRFPGSRLPPLRRHPKQVMGTVQ